MAKTNFKTIDEYIQTFPKDVQKILEKVRQTIKEVAPDAEEAISYQIPTFKLNGNLVYIAAFKNHIGFYPPAPKAFKKEISCYVGPKGNLKFPIDEPMPLSLIKKIVKVQDERICRCTVEKAKSKKVKKVK